RALRGLSGGHDLRRLAVAVAVAVAVAAAGPVSGRWWVPPWGLRRRWVLDLLRRRGGGLARSRVSRRGVRLSPALAAHGRNAGCPPVAWRALGHRPLFGGI